MAISVKVVNTLVGRRTKTVTTALTLSGSYATPGELITPAMVGLTNIRGQIVNPTGGNTAAARQLTLEPLSGFTGLDNDGGYGGTIAGVYLRVFGDTLPLLGVVTSSAADTFTYTSHGLVAGDKVYATSVATSTGISTIVPLFVISSGLTADVFKLSTTAGGSTIDIGTGAGTCTINKVGHGLTEMADAAYPASLTTLPVFAQFIGY